MFSLPLLEAYSAHERCLQPCPNSNAQNELQAGESRISFSFGIYQLPATDQIKNLVFGHLTFSYPWPELA